MNYQGQMTHFSQLLCVISLLIPERTTDYFVEYLRLVISVESYSQTKVPPLTESGVQDSAYHGSLLVQPKGKQRIGALSDGKRSIETKTAVKLSREYQDVASGNHQRATSCRGAEFRRSLPDRKGHVKLLPGMETEVL